MRFIVVYEAETWRGDIRPPRGSRASYRNDLIKLKGHPEVNLP